jgi:hypothetical protein
MIVFGPFCMAHPLVTVDENMLRAEHEGRESEFSGMCVTLDVAGSLPAKQMLTIYGTSRFSRRGSICQLQTIFPNQRPITWGRRQELSSAVAPVAFERTAGPGHGTPALALTRRAYRGPGCLGTGLGSTRLRSDPIRDDISWASGARWYVFPPGCAGGGVPNRMLKLARPTR